jgi:DNA-binding PucR family transcriptional regulator
VESRIHRQARTSTNRPGRAVSGRLSELLRAIDRPAARAFVEEQIGPLLAYDSSNGSDLADQLERALDDLASQPLEAPSTPHPLSAGVMQALELLGADLNRPSDRLTLHLALKLHGIHSAERGGRAFPSG